MYLLSDIECLWLPYWSWILSWFTEFTEICLGKTQLNATNSPPWLNFKAAMVDTPPNTTLHPWFFLSNYHPQTKLWELNVFTGACLPLYMGRQSFMWPVPMMHCDMGPTLLPLPNGHATCVPSPPIHGTWVLTDIWWSSLETWDLPHRYWHLLTVTKSR